MKIVRFVFASSLSSCHVHVNIISQHFCGIRFLKMATFSSLTESSSDWKHIKCSRDELRLDVCLASGQSFRLESYCLWAFCIIVSVHRCCCCCCCIIIIRAFLEHLNNFHWMSVLLISIYVSYIRQLALSLSSQSCCVLITHSIVWL